VYEVSPVHLKFKGDGKTRLRLFKPGILKPIGHQNGFCLDLQDREKILEPFEAKTGLFLTGKIQFLIQEKRRFFTPKLEVFKKFQQLLKKFFYWLNCSVLIVDPRKTRKISS
jgi:hypothetical protein